MNATNKVIHLTYFAAIKDQCGKERETVSTSAATAIELYDELQSKYMFHLSPESLNVAINDTISSWQTELKDHDHIVFIPPVAGG